MSNFKFLAPDELKKDIFVIKQFLFGVLGKLQQDIVMGTGDHHPRETPFSPPKHTTFSNMHNICN